MPSRLSAHVRQIGLLAFVSKVVPRTKTTRRRSPPPMVGGIDFKPGDEATVQLVASRNRCSGALVAPNLVVTAAQCVSVFRSGAISCGAAGDLEQDGSGIGELGGPLDPQEVAIHAASAPEQEVARPFYPSLPARSAFVATISRSSCSTETWNESPTFPIRLGDRVRVGETMTVLGYGLSGVSDREALQRREGVVVVDVGIPPRAFALGLGPCPGDNGGPALSAAGGITGIYSLLHGDCTSRLARNTYTELAPFADLVFEAFGPRRRGAAAGARGRASTRWRRDNERRGRARVGLCVQASAHRSRWRHRSPF